ncbi:MAG: hypothetical protein LBF40_05710 [Deltaproteobacteria bacterium]|jgi:hypothetical protein|nr:hypothetical protein [Deltaproteobacteria bacterium]
MKTIALLTTVLALVFSPSLFAQTFHGFSCTTDCSGHNAGYAWAEANDINEDEYCEGISKSFIEGCLAYIDEHEDISDYYSPEEDFNEDDDYTW